MLTSVELDINM